MCRLLRRIYRQGDHQTPSKMRSRFPSRLHRRLASISLHLPRLPRQSQSRSRSRSRSSLFRYRTIPNRFRICILTQMDQRRDDPWKYCRSTANRIGGGREPIVESDLADAVAVGYRKLLLLQIRSIEYNWTLCGPTGR